MEERNKILTSLRMNSSRRHHYHDSYHSNIQPQLHHMTTTQSDSDDESNSRDPLLEPASAATPSLFTKTTDVLSSSPTSQLSM